MSHPPPSPSLPLFSLPHLFIEAAAPFDLYACGMCVCVSTSGCEGRWYGGVKGVMGGEFRRRREKGGGEKSLFLPTTKAVRGNNKHGEWCVSREALSRVSVRTGAERERERWRGR